MMHKKDTPTPLSLALWRVALSAGQLLVIGWGVCFAEDLKPALVRVGFSHTAFQAVNRNDAEAAFKVFLIHIGRKRGYDMSVPTQIFDDTAQFEAAMRQRTIELAIIDSWSFVAMDIRDIMVPSFIPRGKETTGYRYLLITRRDGRYKTLADLHAGGIVLLNSGANALAPKWLEMLFMDKGRIEKGRFLSLVEVAAKPSATVLPVFFGNRNACVIDEDGFDIMKEMNPQLDAKLRVIESSEPFVNHVICLAVSGWISEDHRKDTVQGLKELDQEPAGRQILTLFKVARLEPFRDEDLDTVKKLRSVYEKLYK